MIFNGVFIIPIVVCFVFIVMAVYFDLKEGSIPNKLNFMLLIFGISFNIFVSFFFGDLNYILHSIIFTLLTFIVSYFLWELNIWGGGDVKLFTSISASIPIHPNISFFTGFLPLISFYPFFITLIFNSILVSFPLILIFLIKKLINNPILPLNKENIFLFFNLGNLRIIIKENLNQEISIQNLKEGMVINNYYFNDSMVYRSIKENQANLKCFINPNNSKYKYYFKSMSISGISFSDLTLLKILYDQNFIKSKLSIKIAFPFAPSILCGFIIAVIYGDLILILLNSLKMVWGVIL